MVIIDDIVWLDRIVEKLAWKHNVFPSEKDSNMKVLSVYEVSDFWDEHDFGEFDDVKEEKGMQFLLRRKKYVGIDMDLHVIIKSKAKALNESEDALINEWLSEKAGT